MTGPIPHLFVCQGKLELLNTALDRIPAGQPMTDKRSMRTFSKIDVTMRTQ